MKSEIIEMMERRHKALSQEDIRRYLKLRSNQQESLQQALDDLVKEGRIRHTKKNRYSLLSGEGCFAGTIQLTERGHGFFLFDEKAQDDVFIHQSHTLGAMNGDRVLMCITKPRDVQSKGEGRVEQILERKTHRLVGTLEVGEVHCFVIPRDRRIRQDIFIPRGWRGQARDGEMVEVEIIHDPKGVKTPQGRIVRILGNVGDPGIEERSVLSHYEIPEEFPAEVLQEAALLEEGISASEKQGRRDFRKEMVVTIDGADAKDFDDAVCLHREDDHYRLWVHIADVTYYVKEGSPLDQEALKRGTSVYFPGMVIPMLPDALSSGICSLKPGEERLCLSVEMLFDAEGNLKDHRIEEGVIQSAARLVYDDVSDFLEGKTGSLHERFDESLQGMAKLAEILHQKRLKRGAIDFGFVESEIQVNEDGWPIAIEKRSRRIANSMIEEFMIVTNEVVSEHYSQKKIPFLYRTHEKPSVEKLEEFNTFLKHFGYQIKGGLEDIHPKTLNDLIEKAKGTRLASMINKLLLRSLKQARYTDFMEGHFGLASTYYSHFTSPIRRYPDLQIHRIIKEDLKGTFSPARKEHYREILGQVAEESSKRERIAEEAERDVDDIKMAQFMSDQVGDEFDATISGITGFGIFAELDNTVEGMIRLSEITQDHFIYDKEHYLLRGERTRTELSVGDKLRVRLIRVSIERGEITFELLDIKEKETVNQ